MVAKTTQRILADIEDAAQTIARNASHAAALDHFVAAVTACFRRGGKLLICGNGGSAADAQHIATEFMVRIKKNRRALPAIALTADPAVLTAIGNDFHFTEIFSRQIEAIGRPGDIVLCLSTSGRSKNVLRAADAARKKKLRVVAFTGKGGSPLASKAHIVFRIDGSSPSRIQEAYMNMLHSAAKRIEELL